jgi:hypothetical protein
LASSSCGLSLGQSYQGSGKQKNNMSHLSMRIEFTEVNRI